MSLLIKGSFFRILQDFWDPRTRHSLLLSDLKSYYALTPSQPPRGSIQRSPSDPNLSGLVPLAVVPSQTLPTVPPSRHRLTVKVKSNPLLVALDIILTSLTDLTIGVPLAGTPPPASRANIPVWVLCCAGQTSCRRPYKYKFVIVGFLPPTKTTKNIYFFNLINFNLTIREF